MLMLLLVLLVLQQQHLAAPAALAAAQPSSSSSAAAAAAASSSGAAAAADDDVVQPRRLLLLLSRATAADDDSSWAPRPANGNVSGSLSFSGDGLTVAYDFTRATRMRPGSDYMGAKWTPPRGGLLSKAPQGSTLGFQLRTNVSRWGFIRVVDSTGQTFQSTWNVKASAAAGGWRLIEQPLRAQNFTGHWMGADDGVIHLPLTTIEIDLVSPAAGDIGRFSLANLSLSCGAGGGSDCSSALEQPFASWEVALGSTASPSAVGVVTEEHSGVEPCRPSRSHSS
jgi:hypothetical protein